MPTANKLLLVAGLGVAVFAIASSQTARATSGGLTVTPATLTLSLAAGETEHSAVFTVTNHYDAPVGLHFGFEQTLGDTPAHDLSGLLSVANIDTTIAPQQTLRQTIILKDGEALRPGGQQLDLVITGTGGAGSQITILPSIRMPILVVKKEGAISSVKLVALAGSALRLTPPSAITATITNDGNMIAIPRGVITVTGPGGLVVSKAVLNTSSQAVSPGSKLSFNNPVSKLANSAWPGLYKVSLSYGLGSGLAEKTASKTFFYIAWWHMTLVGIIAAVSYYYRRSISRVLRQGLSLPRFAKRGMA